MKSRDFDARRLDVRAFAKADASLSGEWPVSGFERLVPSLSPGGASGNVTWQAQGHEASVQGGIARTWLTLNADARLSCVCQRCLQPCLVDVEVERRFLFVADESTAERLDEELEDEVLVATRELDLHVLLEDELLLDLPLVPRHDRCPDPLPVEPDAEAEAGAAAAHPFAVLASLKSGRSGGSSDS